MNTKNIISPKLTNTPGKFWRDSHSRGWFCSEELALHFNIPPNTKHIWVEASKQKFSPHEDGVKVKIFYDGCIVNTAQYQLLPILTKYLLGQKFLNENSWVTLYVKVLTQDPKTKEERLHIRDYKRKIISSSRNLRGIRRHLQWYNVRFVDISRVGMGKGQLSILFDNGDTFQCNFASFSVLKETIRNWRNLYGVRLLVDGVASHIVCITNPKLQEIMNDWSKVD